MNLAQFEQSLTRDGFTAVNREVAGNTINDTHSHPWDVRALVTSGDITLTVDGVATLYKAGDIFTMKAGCPHREVIGGAGVTYLAGRRDVHAT
jgi:quercetin dioxygenase-like cupin family protein